MGVLGKKAKQLEKGLAVGKPKFKKLEEVEQLSSPKGGLAAVSASTLSSYWNSPGTLSGAGQ